MTSGCERGPDLQGSAGSAESAGSVLAFVKGGSEMDSSEDVSAGKNGEFSRDNVGAFVALETCSVGGGSAGALNESAGMGGPLVGEGLIK